LNRLRLISSIAVLGLAVFLAREPILQAAGNYLVAAGDAEKADVIIVLGGDTQGWRAMKGCELLRAGFADRLWLSGAQEFFGLFETDASKQYLVEKGCPADKIEALHYRVDSTRDEAERIGGLMRERGVKKYLLVTSNFHTRRSGYVFRQINPALEGRVVAAANEDFNPDQWWKSRTGRKTFFYEWVKTVSYWLGL